MVTTGTRSGDEGADPPVSLDDVFEGIDRSGPVPLYFQVAQRLEQAISSGRLPAGARLENEIALAERLGLSRPTIRQAIQQLVDRGMLVRRRGVGTQVVHGRVSRSTTLTSLYDDLVSEGQDPRTTVIRFDEIPADDEVASALGLDPGQPVLDMVRVRFASGRPVAVLENFVPLAAGPLDRDALERRGFYSLLRDRGTTIQVAKQRIGARACTDAEARLLAIPPGSAVLTMHRTAYDDSGNALEHGHHCYQPELYSFESTLIAR